MVRSPRTCAIVYVGNHGFTWVNELVYREVGLIPERSEAPTRAELLCSIPKRRLVSYARTDFGIGSRATALVAQGDVLIVIHKQRSRVEREGRVM